MVGKYWVNDDGYIMYSKGNKQIIVCEMYPEHVQALTKIIESHPDLLAACKDALEIVAGERIAYDAFPPNDELTKILEKIVKRCEKKLETAIKKAK